MSRSAPSSESLVFRIDLSSLPNALGAGYCFALIVLIVLSCAGILSFLAGAILDSIVTAIAILTAALGLLAYLLVHSIYFARHSFYEFHRSSFVIREKSGRRANLTLRYDQIIHVDSDWRGIDIYFAEREGEPPGRLSFLLASADELARRFQQIQALIHENSPQHLCSYFEPRPGNPPTEALITYSRPWTLDEVFVWSTESNEPIAFVRNGKRWEGRCGHRERFRFEILMGSTAQLSRVVEGAATRLVDLMGTDRFHAVRDDPVVLSVPSGLRIGVMRNQGDHVEIQVGTLPPLVWAGGGRVEQQGEAIAEVQAEPRSLGQAREIQLVPLRNLPLALGALLLACLLRHRDRADDSN
jgi:hypothetical protein